MSDLKDINTGVGSEMSKASETSAEPLISDNVEQLVNKAAPLGIGLLGVSMLGNMMKDEMER